jgi:endonuclease NucS-like protein
LCALRLLHIKKRRTAELEGAQSHKILKSSRSRHELIVLQGKVFRKNELADPSGGLIDITARDASGSTVIVELKAGPAGQRAAAQILSYMGDMARKEEGGTIRGILAASNFDAKDNAAGLENLSITRARITVAFIRRGAICGPRRAIDGKQSLAKSKRHQREYLRLLWPSFRQRRRPRGTLLCPASFDMTRRRSHRSSTSRSLIHAATCGSGIPRFAMAFLQSLIARASSRGSEKFRRRRLAHVVETWWHI